MSAAAAPPGTRRLFPHELDDEFRSVEDLLEEHRALVVERLLEEGDRCDLAWLGRHLPEADLVTWLAERGPRRLSRRSLAFWHLILEGRPRVPEARPGDALWPL